METPVFQLGGLACFCACDPPRDGKSIKRGTRGLEEDKLDEGLAARAWPQLRSRSQEDDLTRTAFEKPGRGSVPLEGKARDPDLAKQASPGSQGSTAEGTPTPAAGARPRALFPPSAEELCSAPSLGPVGAGGWHFEDEVTEEMKETAQRAEELYRESEKQELTRFNKDFFTSVTLRYYVDPPAPEHLVNALRGRARNEGILSGREKLYLGCSFRTIGWDSTGASVMMAEPCSMKRSLGYMMNQVEYVGWTAFDMNKPGANGFSVIMDFHGGFNPFHFLNPKPILDLAKLIEGQWRRRLKVAFLIDVPGAFQGILNTFLMFVKETTRNKIKCVTLQAAYEELEAMGVEEETLTYAKETLTGRRQRPGKMTWHPVAQHSFFQRRLADLKLSEETEFLSEDMHREVRAAVQEFRIHKWGLPEGRSAGGSAGSAKDPRVVSFDAPSEAVSLPPSVPSRRSLLDLEASPPASSREEEERSLLPGSSSKARRGQKSLAGGCLCGVLTAVRRALPCGY